MQTNLKRKSSQRRQAIWPRARHNKPGAGLFDYAALAEPVRRDVLERAAAIHERIAARPIMQTAEDVVEIGQRLHAVRELLGRAFFQSFLKSEFQWSHESASRFMSAARVFGSVDCLANFQPGALYVLSTKQVPPAALVQALDLARSGKLVKQSTAAEIVLRCHGTSPEMLAVIVACEALEEALEQAAPCLDPRSSSTTSSTVGSAIAGTIAGLMLRLIRWHQVHAEMTHPNSTAAIEGQYSP